MAKITEADLKANYYNVFLINIYALILAVVYGYWMYTADIKLVFCLLVAFACIIGGFILTFMSMNKFIKNKEKENTVQ